SAKLSSVSLSGFGSQATALEERAMDRAIKEPSGCTGVAMSCAAFRWRGPLGRGFFRRALFGQRMDYALFLQAEFDLVLFGRKLVRRPGEAGLGAIDVGHASALKLLGLQSHLFLDGGLAVGH